MFRRLMVSAALACAVVSAANAQKYYRDGAPLSCVLIHASQITTNAYAIVIRGNSFVLYGVYSGETRGTVEVLQPLNGFITLVVKYDGGGADTATVNAANGTASMTIAAVGYEFKGSCN
jgi:hypothetical protein